MQFLRLGTFGCLFVMLCLALSVSIAAQEKINLFDRKNKDRNTERLKRTVQGDLERKIFQALQNSGDTESQNHNQAFTYFGIFFAGLAAVIGGLLYWQMRRKKYAEWTLNDPMALVQELSFVHQLQELEKQFMLDLAEQNSLSSPLRIFIEPKFLLDAWKNESHSESQPVIRQLLSRLFGLSAEETTAPDPAEAETGTWQQAT